MACVDDAPARDEYKLLQLRQSLEDEALDVIKNLGHSATAYHAAKERLERRYGGQRRQIALCLERLEKLQPIRRGNPKDLKRFADLLDIAVINLKDAGRFDELSNGTFYICLQKTIPEEKLVEYHRWLHDKLEEENVESLRRWVIQEAEFETVAHEIICGLDGDRNYQRRDEKMLDGDRNYRRRDGKTFFGEGSGDLIKSNVCVICSDNHPIWSCVKFKDMHIHERWLVAKQNRLCYRCLGVGHIGNNCKRMGICGVKGCKETHNRLLHEEIENEEEKAPNESVRNFMEEETHKEEVTHTTLDFQQQNHVALRTVPVIVKNGGIKKIVNALLDDGSTTTYINDDIAAALNLRGEIRKVTVKVLNNRVEPFQTMPVEFELESANGEFKTKLPAYTTERVSGNMKIVNWKICANRWEHFSRSVTPEVLKIIPVDDRASEIDLSRDKLPVVKTLGLIWMAHEDVFTYRSLPV